MIKEIKEFSTRLPATAIFFTVLLLSSCEYEQREPISVEDLPEVISFQEHIIPIFNQSCNTSACHGGSVPPDLTPDNAYFDLTSGNYLDLDNPENSSFYIKITDGSMAGYATDLDRAFILKWIEQGAPEN
jgi:hypothetical protein